jgi:hypothetical protein
MTILSRDRELWRSSLLVVAVVAMVVASLVGVGIQKADAAERPSIHVLADPVNQFQGRFVRQDAPPPISDGSLDTLIVGGGDSDGVVHARYQESGLSLCDNLVSPPRPLRGFASGFSTIENGTLTLDATLYCVVPGEGLVEQTKLPNLVLVFTFDEASDTVHSGGVCMHRPNEGPCD